MMRPCVSYTKPEPTPPIPLGSVLGRLTLILTTPASLFSKISTNDKSFGVLSCATTVFFVLAAIWSTVGIWFGGFRKILYATNTIIAPSGPPTIAVDLLKDDASFWCAYNIYLDTNKIRR